MRCLRSSSRYTPALFASPRWECRAIAVVRGSRSASRYAPVAAGLACTIVHVFECCILVLCCGSRGYAGWRMPGESNAYKQNKLIVLLWSAVLQTAHRNIKTIVKGSKMHIELAEQQTVTCSVKHNSKAMHRLGYQSIIKTTEE